MRAGRPRAAHARVGARARPQRRAGLRNEQSGWWKVALATGRYREGGQSRSLHRFARMPGGTRLVVIRGASPRPPGACPYRFGANSRNHEKGQQGRHGGISFPPGGRIDGAAKARRKGFVPRRHGGEMPGGPLETTGAAPRLPERTGKGTRTAEKTRRRMVFCKVVRIPAMRPSPNALGIRPQTRRRGGCQAVGETLASEALRACRPGKRPSPRRARAPIRPRAVQASGPAPPRRPRGPASHCPSAAGLCHDAATAG